ncbi:MAG: 50S ribosomal protein L6 [bacterium]|nr:50S ribosomal protein L6 [bacterium]
MSRIGMKPIEIPDKVQVTVDGRRVSVKGPKGELSLELTDPITATVEGGKVIVSRPDDTKLAKSRHGLNRSLIANLVNGVSRGFEKKLEIRGTGYRAKVEGHNLVLNVGFSHQVTVEPPATVAFSTVQRGDFTIVTISGPDKQLVGEIAAQVRRIRPPEPYKGKGIRYDGEWVRQKAGKANVK